MRSSPPQRGAKFLVAQEDVNLVETGFDGENIAVHLHVSLHTLVIDVKFQVFGNLCAALCYFLCVVTHSTIASYVIFYGALCIVNVAAIVFENQTPDFTMFLHKFRKLMHPLNAFPFGKANSSEAFKLMDCPFLCALNRRARQHTAYAVPCIVNVPFNLNPFSVQDAAFVYCKPYNVSALPWQQSSDTHIDT